MPLLEGELEGEEASSVCEEFIGGSGVGFGSRRDVQHELGTGSEICRDCPGDDGEDQRIGAEPRQKKRVIRISGDQSGGNQCIRESGWAEENFYLIT